jgi:hypothetical protein
MTLTKQERALAERLVEYWRAACTAAHEATKAERDEALQYVAELEASHGHAEARIKELEGAVLCNQQAADREYVRCEAAKARVAEVTAAHEADRASLLALQAKVTRLLELYDVWLKARGASYQLAEDDFYQAVEALR